MNFYMPRVMKYDMSYPGGYGGNNMYIQNNFYGGGPQRCSYISSDGRPVRQIGMQPIYYTPANQYSMYGMGMPSWAVKSYENNMIYGFLNNILGNK